MANFRPTDRLTRFLLPPSIDEWLPERHLARFVVEVIEGLDLTAMSKSYRGSGSASYHPAPLLGLLIYRYATGVFSSRKLERATYDSVAFRFIAANDHPDHDTIAAFRRRFLKDIEALFVKVLLLAREMGVLQMGAVALDGTKIHANASRHSALSYEHAGKVEAQLKAEVAELLKKAETADQTDIPDGMSIPEELARREDRLKTLAAARAKIEARAKERYERELAEHEAKMAARAAVAADSLLVIAVTVTQAPNDKNQIEPILDEIDALPDELGEVETLLADTGYFSAANVDACDAAGIEPMIAAGRQPHHPPLSERFGPEPEPPENPTPVEAMAYRMKTRAGRDLYALRKQIPEPVFGIIKSVMGFRQFLLRGLDKVRGEWSLVTMAWNMKGLFALYPQA